MSHLIWRGEVMAIDGSSFKVVPTKRHSVINEEGIYHIRAWNEEKFHLNEFREVRFLKWKNCLTYSVRSAMDVFKILSPIYYPRFIVLPEELTRGEDQSRCGRLTQWLLKTGGDVRLAPLLALERYEPPANDW